HSPPASSTQYLAASAPRRPHESSQSPIAGARRMERAKRRGTGRPVFRDHHADRLRGMGTLVSDEPADLDLLRDGLRPTSQSSTATPAQPTHPKHPSRPHFRPYDDRSAADDRPPPSTRALGRIRVDQRLRRSTPSGKGAAAQPAFYVSSGASRAAARRSIFASSRSNRCSINWRSVSSPLTRFAS